MCVPDTTVWDRLDDDSRTRLLDGAMREVARRSLAGAMVYFGTIAALPFASSCLKDHPILTIWALLCTFVGGVTRCVAALRLLRPPAPDRLWSLALKISTLMSVGPWGAFCAATLYFYRDSWPSTYLLITGAVLAAGVATSLAPQLRLGMWALLLTVLPTAICGFILGTARSQILGISTCAYLAYLMFQFRHTWRAYWKIAAAPALDAMLSRRVAEQSQARFRMLFEDAPVGIYLAGHDGRIEMTNRALAQMLGYLTPEEIAGCNLQDLSPESDRTPMRGPLEENGYLAGWESDWRRKEGVPIRVRESIRAVQAGMDPRGRLLGMVEDITAHFVADRDRRQLIEILEGTSDFVESVAVTGESLYRNRASRVLSGECADINDAKPVWNRSGDEDLSRARLRFADEEGIWQGESWLLAADGRAVPVSQVIIPHRSNDGSTYSYSIVSRDVTAMRDAEKALRETQEQLFQAQRLESMGRLAGGIAHDFNNLLTIIMGHASILTPGLKNGEARDSVVEIAKAAERAADLTRQLLAFGRKQVLSKRVVDVKEIVTGAEKMLRRLIGERIDLVTRLSEESQLVFADPAQLEQVLVNLILNGRDAMPHGGVATIDISRAPGASEPELAGESPRDYVRIAVSDTGIGMDENTMTRIFEPFFTTKARGQGTGLGLATAYGFIRQSGGTISVSSKPGEGTTFLILLPRCTAAIAAVPPRMEISDPTGNERILVVDDEPALRGLLRQTLAGYGYHVVEARDGEQALAMARDSRDPFDLLVTDVIMPGITGPQLAGRLKLVFPDMAVLFISGYPGETAAERSAFGPAASYLAKPFTAEVLLQSVRQQLERGRRAFAKAG